MSGTELSRCAKELKRQGLIPETVLAFFCVGSAALGWQNEGSDFDFVAVTSEVWRDDVREGVPVPLKPDFVPVAARYIDGRRCEIKYWLDDQIDQVVEKVGWERFEQPQLAPEALDAYEEMFLERLLTCVVFEGDGWVLRRREQLSSSAFKPMMVRRSLSGADGATEDALGQLKAGDVASAVLSARTALGHTVDALLESKGHFGSRSVKWRARRVCEAALADLDFGEYWDLESMRDYIPATPGTWVERVITYCRNLQIKTVVD